MGWLSSIGKVVGGLFGSGGNSSNDLFKALLGGI